MKSVGKFRRRTQHKKYVCVRERERKSASNGLNVTASNRGMEEREEKQKKKKKTSDYSMVLNGEALREQANNCLHGSCYI